MRTSSMNLSDSYKTLKSKYGYKKIDVRATYQHLPFQFFWTWVTGKALVTGIPKKPSETLLSMIQFHSQIVWSWSVIFLSIYIGANYSGDYWDSLAVSIIAIVLVTNRTRGLLHTFHYTIHGASISNRRYAKWIAKYFLNIPIMHTPWSQYQKLHVIDHHKPDDLCTDRDPDQLFMIAHGFRPKMGEFEFWFKLIFSPFNPARIIDHLIFRFKSNFVNAELTEIIPRTIYWILFFSIGIYFDILYILAIYYLFPLFIVTQYSSYLQHIIEHLWFPVKQKDIPAKVFNASLTWGRFLGRPFPILEDSPHWNHYLNLLTWWLQVFVIDIPIRVFSYMQDLPSHDFHHRSPGINFWAIPYERANSENRESPWGPMTETWSITESILILRDHLVRGESDPFGVYHWAVNTTENSTKYVINKKHG